MIELHDLSSDDEEKFSVFPVRQLQLNVRLVQQGVLYHNEEVT